MPNGVGEQERERRSTWVYEQSRVHLVSRGKEKRPAHVALYSPVGRFVHVYFVMTIAGFPRKGGRYHRNQSLGQKTGSRLVAKCSKRSSVALKVEWKTCSRPRFPRDPLLVSRTCFWLISCWTISGVARGLVRVTRCSHGPRNPWDMRRTRQPVCLVVQQVTNKQHSAS